MKKKINIYGGGANTNINGLAFEQSTQLFAAFLRSGYEIKDTCKVFKKGEFIGWTVAKYKLYTEFLKPNNIDYTIYNSKKWLPDECFINISNKTAYIIEKKFQNGSGSVDEKLPNCEFKKWEYEKLFKPLGYKVEFYYIFNDWFTKPEYKDTLDYILKKGCKYFYNVLPLNEIGL